MLLITFHHTVTGKKEWIEIIITPVSESINQILPSLHYLFKKGSEFHRETEALQSKKWVICGSTEYCGDHVMVSGSVTDTEFCGLMVKGQAWVLTAWQARGWAPEAKFHCWKSTLSAPAK